MTKGKFMFKYIIFFLILVYSAQAQTHTDVLKQIMSNNKEIKAFQEYSNSLNFSSRTNLLPLNPMVEYSYLAGSGLTSGNKQEFVISQAFDFPSIYFQKSDIADLQNKSYDYKLKEFKRNTLDKAQHKLIDYIYLTKIITELTNRVTLAENINKTVQIRFDKGDVGIMELNKAKFNLSLTISKLNLAKIELNSTVSELVNLNGGETVNINFEEYPAYELISDFDSLISEMKNPAASDEVSNTDGIFSIKSKQASRNLPK